jgi:hypothetical protein
MTRGVPDTTARYDRSVYVAKLQSDGEPAYEPAMNRIRPSRVLVLLLRTHTRRKTLQSALQVLQELHHSKLQMHLCIMLEEGRRRSLNQS